MLKHRSSRFRPSALDRLEDRVVPSGGVGHAQVAAAATSTAASRLTTLQTQLGTAGTTVNAAFATFATSVRQVEQALLASVSGGTTAVPALAQVDAQVATLAGTLASSVASAYGNVAAIGSNAAVIASGLDGTAAGSLETQLTALFNGAYASGGLAPATLPLLFTSVEATMGVSYNDTSIEGFVAGVGGSGLISASSSESAFNLTTFGTQANAAYATFAISIRTLEASLPTDASAGTGTLASVQAATVTAADTLATTLVNDVTGTTAEPIVALRSIEEDVPLAYYGQLPSVAAPTGVVSSADLTLLYANGENAINGSYEATIIQAYLIASLSGEA